VEAARGRYICLLNNDAFVHDAWLAPLGSFMEANPQAGAVGPRFLYPDGRLQEAGALVDAEGSVIQIGKGEAAEDPKFGSVRKVDYVSAACVLMRRKEFLRPYVATTTSVDTADRFGDVLVMFLSSSRFP
jgi:GT2 family glycosyltransferase